MDENGICNQKCYHSKLEISNYLNSFLAEEEEDSFPPLHNELQNNDLKLGSPIFRETPNEPVPNPFSQKQEHHQLLHPVHHEVKSVNHEEKQVNHFKATTLPPSAISNHNSHHTNTKPFLESTTPSTFLGKYL